MMRRKYGSRRRALHNCCMFCYQGVYIANQLEVGAMTAQTMKQRNWNDFVETLITFNGGGHWQHLQVRSCMYRVHSSAALVSGSP